jgi:hypothetical protein
MKNILASITNFITSLGLVDVIFLAAILLLIILIVVLIYIIRINDGEMFEDDAEEEKAQSLKDNILKTATDSDTDIDLAQISKDIESSEPKPIILNKYEQEQEEKAIISYDELLKTKQNYQINYQDEEDVEGLKVKKIDVNNLTSILPSNNDSYPNTDDCYNKQTILISYDKEEAFLAALKKLQKQLN